MDQQHWRQLSSVSVTACPDAMDRGDHARRRGDQPPSIGSIATPSPSIRSANTGSGTSSSGVAQPASGLAIVTLIARDQRQPVEHPERVGAALGEGHAQSRGARVCAATGAGDRAARRMLRVAGAERDAGDRPGRRSRRAAPPARQPACAGGGSTILFTSAPIEKLNGTCPTSRRQRRVTPSSGARVQIQHGCMMSPQWTRRLPAGRAVILEPQRDCALLHSSSSLARARAEQRRGSIVQSLRRSPSGCRAGEGLRARSFVPGVKRQRPRIDRRRGGRRAAVGRVAERRRSPAGWRSVDGQLRRRCRRSSPAARAASGRYAEPEPRDSAPNSAGQPRREPAPVASSGRSSRARPAIAARGQSMRSA